MDTKPLERFATQARRDLLSAVDAQATVVLSPGSIARSERAEVVKKLEGAIGRHGRQHVVDKVAYTWFNRIIALRFMDARGYTDAGVVSPAQGQVHGQPEILADAKRGNLDVEVVMNTRTADAIVGLLDGTRRSTDAEGEAYALLLTEYCRYWHKAMPFMFEGEGDYTELLVPVDLLAADAILARARVALTEDVCDDVEVIGWLYQFYISERKKEVFDGFSAKGTARRLAGPEEIPAATQLFTPHWIVRYLVENSLGRLWMLNRPTSRLVDHMPYYFAPVDEELNFLKISKPNELTVIDPACGSGHMLTYAFDLLYAIYEEEGYAQSDIPGLILTHNLHGTEIDPRAGALAAFSIVMKARAKQRTFFDKKVRPNICVIEPISFTPDELDYIVTKSGDNRAEEVFWNQFREADTFGSLIEPDVRLAERLASFLETLDSGGDFLQEAYIERATKVLRQARFLLPRYSVVVANPPYMGAARMGGVLTAWLKAQLPLGKAGLDVAFWQRSMEFLVPGGLAALVTMHSWMFLATYADFRAAILDKWTVGAVAAIMATSNSREHHAVYVKLTKSLAKEADAMRVAAGESPALRFDVSLNDLSTIPRTPIAYWMGEAERAVFGLRPSVATICRSGNGLTSSDNDRFLRFWWEVGQSKIEEERAPQDGPSQRRWNPINKGGGFRRWAGNRDFVVDWACDGKELYDLRPTSTVRNPNLYFRPSVSWSDVVTGPVSFRFYPKGWIFDASANSLFPTGDDVEGLLAVANSSFVGQMAPLLNPGLHFKLGDMGSLPYLKRTDPGWREEIEELVGTAQCDWDSSETGGGFGAASLIAHKGAGSFRLLELIEEVVKSEIATTKRVHKLESKNNAEIARQYDLDSEYAVPWSIADVSLLQNPWAGGKLPDCEAEQRHVQRLCLDLVSYAIGCIFGRFSLETPGLILADQGATLQDFVARVPSSAFRPDVDNVIPIVDDGWFEDDIVERLRQFLRAALGAEHFEENLRFVEESLGVKTLRDYFITKAGKSKFYDDHVQRYKKRPIYWMFSSPKGSFNALIYIHRYTPSTVSTVLNEYLREYRAKLEVALTNAELAKEQKEADRLRRVLLELAEYEHDVLYPLATQQIAIDLDDGVKTNYPKFYPALRKITGLEAAL
jgi:hypothetical protein